MLLGGVLLIAGIALVLWGAERFTDGALGLARTLRVSAFWLGAVLSGFEPENLATGVAATSSGLPQIALGTVVGSAVFMLTAGFGVALVIQPMAVAIPRAGGVAMLLALGVFAVALADGVVTRAEGLGLVAVALALLGWLYRRSPAFRAGDVGGDVPAAGPPSRRRAVALVVVGLAATVAGAEAVVAGARMVLATALVSETFLGMAVVGLGESVEETARMVVPARRGHPELALGNVVGTLVVLVTLNLGLIALVRPPVADPRVLVVHAPYLGACAVAVAVALLAARRLGRAFGAVLLLAYAAYLGLNVLELR